MRISDWSSDVCSSDLTTASGLQYEVLTEGKGSHPKATDTVTVNYKGSLINGEEFDSTYSRGQRSEEHTSELQVTNAHLVCRLLLEKKKKKIKKQQISTTNITQHNISTHTNIQK